jgi:hypothetical protein
MEIFVCVMFVIVIIIKAAPNVKLYFTVTRIVV